ncbi:Predicted ATP-binding protein involved in virulence [Sinosporangium album]|uniref:Predicted ATP-binding protein involved in virulence n=1 Tax=Sinosporangium album TaxID=504805 RepID=A0A1G7SBA2_9ACTN|nr:AAA family ATPase [Sinosporangium album]SDG20288.1 Predicted ATP-binding protein involved in virulence [Sinosporangium album]
MYIAEIKISGVRGFYGGRSVDLQLTRPEGTQAGWTVLAGRNGSGKSTLLRAAALAAAGPSVARSLVPAFDGWLSHGRQQGFVEAAVVPDRKWDEFTGRGRVSKDKAFPARLTWTRERFEDSGRHAPHPSLHSEGTTAARGPWADNPQGWFFAGYGPFRRLVGGSSDAQRLMLAGGPVSRLAGLFHEDASLAESVTWLIDLHLRRLEGRPGAAELLSFVIDLLNDGLLPDGFQIECVDRDGLWVTRDGQTISLREMSDGYRTVTALVLDLVRQLNETYTSVFGDWPTEGKARVFAPGVVLIDEIDAHLHVSWQKKIGGWLKEHFPAIQFIVSSHSPYICQSADPGGLIRLPGVDEETPPRVVDEDLYERVVYGSGDDALLSDLFGVDSPYSDRAEDLRRRLTRLERAVLRGQATAEELADYKGLRDKLTSSLSARVDEVTARIADIP